MAIKNTSRSFFRLILEIDAGGTGNDVGYVHRVRTYERFGVRIPTYKFVALDFVSNPPTAPKMWLPDYASDSSWKAVEPGPKELALIGYPQGLTRELIDRVTKDLARFGWLEDIIPLDILPQFIGRREAAGIPAICRCFMALNAAIGGVSHEPSWWEKLDDALGALSPHGEAVASLVRMGLDRSQILAAPILVLIVVGSSGGTGHGAAEPLAIAAHHAAKRRGLQIDVRLHAVTGPYRPTDSQLPKKLALSTSFWDDVEDATVPSTREWTFPVGPGEYLKHTGPLFHTAYRHEANERFDSNYAAVLANVGRGLFHEYFSRAAYDFETVLHNE
jgi:hypothetical protein